MAEEKRAVETAEKRYAILTRESIQMSAEAGGHVELPDDVPSMLGEDVSYRLRAIVQLGAQFMRHSRRRRMTTEDINKALKTMDVQPIHGHGSLDQLAFQQTREGEIHFVEDSEVSFANIASNSYIPKYNGNTSIKSHWLAVEGVQKSSSSQQQQTNPAQPGKPPSKSGQKAVAEHLQYYDNITKAILGGDEELAKIALEDLRTNSKLVPLLPYFVNFVSNGVKTISYDIKQLTKLLHTVKVLTVNPHLYLEPKPYLTLLVQAVTYCLLEPLAASINPLIDHWVLRDYAARLLAQIIHRWQTPVNQVLQSSLRALTEAFHDLSRPACTHYGAIMGLLYLGSQYVEETVIPHLPTFWPHLQTMLGDTSTANALAKSDAHKIYGALLLAVELLIKRKLKDFEAECTKAPVPVLEELERETRDEISIVDEKVESAVSVSKECTKPGQQNAREFYADMYEYFGDSLSMRLPKLNLHHIFKPTSRETIVSLRDPEIDGKTGEDLLHEFMEQVRLQQIREEEERKVREELERQKAIEHRKVMLRRLEIQRAEDERRRKETEMRRREDEARRRHEAEIRRQHEERVRHRERIQLEQQQLRQMEMSRHHAMQQASALQYPPVATYDRIEEHSEDDPDVDVEETSDRSPESEKSEEETYPTPSPKALSVKVSDPHKGIKLTIKLGGRPEEKGGRTDRPQVEKYKDKEYKHSKKRKQSGRSPRESSHSPWESDSYESPDPKRKGDNVYQFENRPRSATSKRMSQRETDDSDSYERVDDDQSHSQPKITLKLSKSKFMGASTSQSSPSYS